MYITTDPSKMKYHHNLFEGLSQGDLARLIPPLLTIDEFKSKMGDDEDIIVLSFRVQDKEPALDLMNFVERGYDWVFDSDVSAGEEEDGEYIVFVELERTPKAPDYIIKLITDILHLTNQEMQDWHVKYKDQHSKFECNKQILTKLIPLTPREYNSKYGDQDLEAMRASARIPSKKTAPKNPWTESLRSAAGIK